jgi:hypothetical protein
LCVGVRSSVGVMRVAALRSLMSAASPLDERFRPSQGRRRRRRWRDTFPVPRLELEPENVARRVPGCLASRRIARRAARVGRRARESRGFPTIFCGSTMRSKPAAETSPDASAAPSSTGMSLVESRDATSANLTLMRRRTASPTLPRAADGARCAPKRSGMSPRETRVIGPLPRDPALMRSSCCIRGCRWA